MPHDVDLPDEEQDLKFEVDEDEILLWNWCDNDWLQMQASQSYLSHEIRWHMPDI